MCIYIQIAFSHALPAPLTPAFRVCSFKINCVCTLHPGIPRLYICNYSRRVDAPSANCEFGC